MSALRLIGRIRPIELWDRSEGVTPFEGVHGTAGGLLFERAKELQRSALHRPLSPDP